MNDKVSLNINDLANEILKDLRMELSDQEKREFINKYIKQMKFDINDDNLRVKVSK